MSSRFISPLTTFRISNSDESGKQSLYPDGDSDRHRNLIICLLAHCRPSWKFRANPFERFCAKLLTDKQTNKQWRKHILLDRGNDRGSGGGGGVLGKEPRGRVVYAWIAWVMVGCHRRPQRWRRVVALSHVKPRFASSPLRGATGDGRFNGPETGARRDGSDMSRCADMPLKPFALLIRYDEGAWNSFRDKY